MRKRKNKRINILLSIHLLYLYTNWYVFCVISNKKAMKIYLTFILFVPFFCFAQQNRSQPVENKPSSTDCPTWKKKDVKANKADYFQYLKTSKSQKSVPTSTASKEKPANTRQIAKNEESEVIEKTSVLKTDEKRIENKQTVKKSQTAVDTKTSQLAVNEDKESVKTVPGKAKLEEEKSVASTTKSKDENNDSQKSDKADSEKKEKLDGEKPKAKQKSTRLTRKTTKVRKHSNSKCPAF